MKKSICYETETINYWINELSVLLHYLKHLVRTNDESADNFITFSYRITQSSNKAPSTRANIFTTIHHLEHFCQEIEFADINYSFVWDFDKFLHKQGIRQSTIGKHLRHLRTLINEAVRSGYMASNPFRDYTIKGEKSSPMALTTPELSKLEAYWAKGSHRDKPLQAFLLSVYSGLRFSDIVTLSPHDILKKDGHVWIEKKMQKTGQVVRVPVDLLFGGKGLKLLRNPDFGTLRNGPANKRLKQAAHDLGIRPFTFHAGRHTFAMMLLEKGVPITTIQKLCGHTSIKTTTVYADTDTHIIVSDLQRANCEKT